MSDIESSHFSTGYNLQLNLDYQTSQNYYQYHNYESQDGNHQNSSQIQQTTNTNKLDEGLYQQSDLKVEPVLNNVEIPATRNQLNEGLYQQNYYKADHAQNNVEIPTSQNQLNEGLYLQNYYKGETVINNVELTKTNCLNESLYQKNGNEPKPVLNNSEITATQNQLNEGIYQQNYSKEEPVLNNAELTAATNQIKEGLYQPSNYKLESVLNNHKISSATNHLNEGLYQQNYYKTESVLNNDKITATQNQLKTDDIKTEPVLNNAEITETLNELNKGLYLKSDIKVEYDSNNVTPNHANYPWQQSFPNYHQNQTNLSNFHQNQSNMGSFNQNWSSFYSDKGNFYQYQNYALPSQNNFDSNQSNHYKSSPDVAHQNHGNVVPNPSISTPNQGSYQTNQGTPQQTSNGFPHSQWQNQSQHGLFQQNQAFIPSNYAGPQNFYTPAQMWNNYMLNPQQLQDGHGEVDPYGRPQQGNQGKPNLNHSNDETSDLGSSFNSTGSSDDSFSSTDNNYKVESVAKLYNKMRAPWNPDEWVADPKTLPNGWKRRKRKGNLKDKLVFLSPTNERFTTRIAVEAYMTKHSHIYTKDDIKRFRLNYNSKIREYSKWDNTDLTLPKGWFKREYDYQSPDGIMHKEYQYLSREKKTFSSRNAARAHMQKIDFYSQEDIEKFLSGKGNGRPRTYLE